ncbi:hypothetical protein ASF14_11240 [Sphingomonas sp. Leaf257]|nr:hypothetical protein ASF14_11240 [Sphingomonas sp. Leaf257]
MAMRSVGFQLRTDGKAEVKNDFAEVRKAGQDAMSGVAEAAEQAADRAAKAADALTERQIASYRKQANAAKLAAAGADSRSAIDAANAQRGNGSQFATVNLDRSTGAARESAAVFERELKLQDERAAALQKIRALLDPLAVAQRRYDDELETYNDLLARGDLKEEEHAAALAISRDRLNAAAKSLDAHSNSLGLNRMQFIVGAAAARNFMDSVLAGASPMRAFMQQAGDVVTVMQSDDGGVAGALTKVRNLLTPTRLALGATTAAAALGASAWYDYSSAVDKMNAVSMGSGRMLGLSGAALEANAEAAAKAGDMSVAAAREIELSFVETGKITGGVLIGLTALTKDFAAATGQDAKGAASQLAAAFADPIKGAEDLAERYGVINQSTADYIQKLVEQNDMTGAQRALLDALGPAFKGAADNANFLARAWDGISDAASNAWTWMGKAIDRAVTGGSVQDRIASLQQQRALGPSVGQMLLGTTTASYQADIDRQIAGLRTQLTAEARRGEQARANAAQARGQQLVDQFTGADQLGGYRANAGRLRAALNTGVSGEQRQQLTTTLDAYNHAIDTFIPKQDKANQLAAIDAKIAAAKSPAAKAALASERARVEMSGEVVTRAQVEAQALAQGNRARTQAANSGASHAATLAREAESMEVSARAALDVADAYLKSSAAGVEAEARRKASTDATRKGISVDEQVRRQLNLQVSEGVATSAKAIAGLRDETAARRAANDNVAAGKITAAQLNQTLSDEAALRPLIAMQVIAQAQGQTKAYEQITRAIAAYRQALADAHAEEARSAGAAAIEATKQRTAETVASILDMSKSPLQLAMAAARRAANKEADDKKYTDADRAALVSARVDEARATNAQAMARYILDASRAQADQLELSQRELELAGVSDQVRTRELDKLRIQQEIRRQFPDMEQADIDARMRGIDVQDAINTKLKVTAAAMNELRGYGAEFVDSVLSPQAWSDWETLGKAATGSIRNEFIKLALLNPIKNLINGNKDLPTLGSVFGNIGKLFGGASAIQSGVDLGAWSEIDITKIGRNASGTARWSGGLTWVNENGGEIADLPDGTRIYPAAETRRMLAGNDNAGFGGISVTVNAQDSVLAETVRGWVAEGIAVASTRGAAGGAAMAGRNAKMAARRRLPGT